MKRSAADGILEEAATAARLDDFGDDWFLGPLGAFVSDLEQPNLTDRGRRFLRALAVRDVERRLRVLDTLRRHEEISEVPLPRILYVTGPERSGTTFLHNVLALHRNARALLRWELMEPVPPPETETWATDPRIAAVQAPADKLRGSPIERMHWVNADEPEECVWGFIDAVSMLGQSPCLCLPRWRAFLLDEDLTPAFAHYRQVIQVLLWKHPLGPGAFLALKAPQIAVQIDAFAGVFPEARFVITDRDPFRCITSLAVLGHAILGPFCVDNPLADDGLRDRLALSWMRPKFTGIGQFSDAAPDRVMHVAYPQMVGDPVGSAERVFAAFGLPADNGFGLAVDGYLAAQRSGGRAAPPVDLPTMGYSRSDLASDPVIDGYCRTFGIELEESRLTGG